MTAGQRDLNDVQPASSRNLTGWRQLSILRAQWSRRMRRICLNTRWVPATPFHLLKSCHVKQVQFTVIQVLDGLTQVFRQDMPLRCGFGCRLCSRCSQPQRRSISGLRRREEVGRGALIRFAAHDVIMALGMEGGNVLNHSSNPTFTVEMCTIKVYGCVTRVSASSHCANSRTCGLPAESRDSMMKYARDPTSVCLNGATSAPDSMRSSTSG